MRRRTLPLTAAAGAALLAAGPLPTTASASVREGSVDAAELLAKVSSCRQISSGLYRTDEEATATVPVCGTDDVVFWEADMDIDCDGRRTAACNEKIGRASCRERV